jgi:3-oxoacyl-[acyl-carrier protein] reductase
VILGPFSTTIQNLILNLTAQGADVALIDKEAAKAQKFCQNVNDQREANDKLGRAMAIESKLDTELSIKDALGKAAQTFGSIDIFVDAMMVNTPAPLPEGQESIGWDELLHQNLKVTLMATQFVAHFLRGRKRGRIIYLLNEAHVRGAPQDALAAAARTGLIGMAKALGRQMQEHNVTVNCLSLGLTEEYLQGHFPDAGTIKEALEKMRALEPGVRITEPDKISNGILFLCSPGGGAITGQSIILS